MTNRNKPKRWIGALLALSLGSVPSLASAQMLWPDFPDAAQTPSITNHINPQHNDSVPLDAPVGVQELWSQSQSYSHFNPCASGPEGNIYCVSYKGPGGECNLLARDYKTGELLWDDGDANGGTCLLDIFAFPTTPFVDRDGNVYAGDSQIIVSFTSDGEVRWIQDYPADLTATSPTGRPNPPFGMNMLPTGELITGTLGDAFILVMDRDTGDLLAAPFDVPGEKLSGGGEGALRPPWANNKFGCGDPNENLPPCGDAGAQAAWDSSFADTANENDNDISVDAHTGTIFMTGAAEAPNDLCEEPDDPTTPCGDGKVWAMSYDPDKPFEERISIRFSVRFPGPGGSATTPGVSADGLYAVVGNNTAEALVTDIPLCLAEFDSEGTAENNYNECLEFANIPLFSSLLASPTITPDNILMVLQNVRGVIAFQLAGRGTGITGPVLWHWDAPEMVPRCDKSELGPGETLLPPFLIPFPLNCDGATTFRTAQAVVTAYNNATYFSYVTVQILGFDPTVGGQFGLLGPVTTTMVAVDTQTGEELSATTEGVREIANVTMAADEATLISNNFGFLTQVFWDRGLMGFNPACGPVPPFGSGCPPPITFKLLEPKPFDMAAPGGVVAWTPFRPEEPISGKHLKVMDEVSAADNFLSFETEDASIEMPGPGSALDPRRHSAEVTLFNPTTGEKQVIGLPAENWSLKNNRYDYKDSDRASGPCDKVKLADGVLEVRCGGEQLTFSLDEPSQGSLGVGFNISPSIVMCALFGGDIKEDSGSAEGGSFKSDYAEPSDECVIPD